MKLELTMRRDGGVLRPHGDVATDLFFDSVPSGVTLMVTIAQPRNPDHHNKFFAICAKVANYDEDFFDAADVAEWIKLQIPSMRKEYVVPATGRVIVRTKSISWAAMSQVEFNQFYDIAMKLLAEKIGCDPELLLEDKT